MSSFEMSKVVYFLFTVGLTFLLRACQEHHDEAEGDRSQGWTLTEDWAQGTCWWIPRLKSLWDWRTKTLCPGHWPQTRAKGHPKPQRTQNQELLKCPLSLAESLWHRMGDSIEAWWLVVLNNVRKTGALINIETEVIKVFHSIGMQLAVTNVLWFFLG